MHQELCKEKNNQLEPDPPNFNEFEVQSETNQIVDFNAFIVS